MPHAELRGKLSSTGTNAHERSEDLLTSDVFGRLRYLEPDIGLLPVLERAVNFRSGASLRLPAPASLSPVYRFWPSIHESEPDVLIEWDVLDGARVKVLVECKHLSGKSGAFAPNADDQEAEAASADADQLRREYHDLRRLGGHGVLLYITGHRALPHEDFQATVAALGARGEPSAEFEAATYWLGWPEIWAALQARSVGSGLAREDRLVLEDIVALLAHKGYRWFQGISLPAFPVPDTKRPVWYRSDHRSYRWVPPFDTAKARPGPTIFYDRESRMIESGAGSTIQQTLDYVCQVYEETALLMKDLAAALKKREFRSLLGNSNGSTGSKHLNWPRQWLPRYISGYWVPEGTPVKGRKATYVAASVLFADLNDRAVEPLLVYGVAHAMDNEKASYQYCWLSDIHFNKDLAFRRTQGDGNHVLFQCVKYGAGSYEWARSGILIARPLISIAGRAEVEALADQLVALWNSEAARK